MAGSAILSYFVARVLSAPINRMALALRSIGSGDLDYRLRGIRSRDEMQDLAHEINEMAERLREADSLRAEFVSFASHELRNPLTAVKGFVETLTQYDTADERALSLEERREIYEIIQSECDRLLRMTNELLQTSRVEAGLPIQMKVTSFDIRKPIEKVVAIMRTHTDRHDLTAALPEQPLLVEGDIDKIEQVLINLLSNAIKYSPRGGPIEVMAEDRGNTIEFSVRDQGVGMTPEQAQHVFDKYYRIQDGSLRAKPGDATGSGIGLYLTRALVNAHGGTVRVRSTPDEGSVFIVTLPKIQSPGSDPASDGADRRPEPTPRYDRVETTPGPAR
jgi:two-component system phosphate regulon sensor histidine kinase PhoR